MPSQVDEKVKRQIFRKCLNEFPEYLRFIARTTDQHDIEAGVKDYPCPPHEPDFWYEPELARLMQETKGEPPDITKVLYIIKSRQIRCTWRLAHYFAWILLTGKEERTAIFSMDLEKADTQNIDRTWQSLRYLPYSEHKRKGSYYEVYIHPPFPINGAGYLEGRRTEGEIRLEAYESSSKDNLLYTNWMKAMTSARGETFTFAAIDEAAEVDGFKRLLDQEIRPQHTWERPIIVQGTVKGRREFDKEALNESKEGKRHGKINPDQQEIAFESPDNVPDKCASAIRKWENYRGDLCLMVKCYADPWKVPGTDWWEKNIELGGEGAQQEYLCDRDVILDKSRVWPKFSREKHTFSADEERYPDLVEPNPESVMVRSWDYGERKMACVVSQPYGDTLVHYKSFWEADTEWQEFALSTIAWCNKRLPRQALWIDTGDVQAFSSIAGPTDDLSWVPMGVIRQILQVSKSPGQHEMFKIKRPMIEDHHVVWTRERLNSTKNGRPLMVVNGDDDGLINAFKQAVWNIPDGKQEPRKGQPICEYPEMDIKDCCIYADACVRQHSLFQDELSGGVLDKIDMLSGSKRRRQPAGSGSGLDFNRWNK